MIDADSLHTCACIKRHTCARPLRGSAATTGNSPRPRAARLGTTAQGGPHGDRSRLAVRLFRETTRGDLPSTPSNYRERSAPAGPRHSTAKPPAPHASILSSPPQHNAAPPCRPTASAAAPGHHNTTAPTPQRGAGTPGPHHACIQASPRVTHILTATCGRSRPPLLAGTSARMLKR